MSAPNGRTDRTNRFRIFARGLSLTTIVACFFVWAGCRTATPGVAEDGKGYVAPPSGESSEASVWTVRAAGAQVASGCDGGWSDYTIAKLEFTDDGNFAIPGQLEDAIACIQQTRQASGGAIVVTFIHGWKHNAAWDPCTDDGDEHFRNFRAILQSLGWREMERGTDRRPVVGIYFGWPGDAKKGLGALSPSLSFWNRYGAAETIGSSEPLRTAILEITVATKIEQRPGENSSPLILAGHSMGAYILERSILDILRNDLTNMVRPRGERHCAIVTSRLGDVLFPDAVVLLNSAADAQLARELNDELETAGIRREVSCGGIPYSAPLVLSATAVQDEATGRLYPMARPGRRTEGHDPELRTHNLIKGDRALCRALDPRERFTVADRDTDFNQSWACIRNPQLTGDGVTLTVDLPDPDRPRNDCHVRHQLIALRPNPGPFWIFHVPEDVSGAHSDIFNARSNLTTMSFAQAAGALMSLARTWDQTFALDEGPCDPNTSPDLPSVARPARATPEGSRCARLRGFPAEPVGTAGAGSETSTKVLRE